MKLNAFPVEDQSEKTLERLADFLRSVSHSWKEASQEQRNKLARSLFEEVRVRDRQVVEVKPARELSSSPGYLPSVNKKGLLATPTRFELAISALTGLHVEPLHHGAA